jgi:hypothetical protein
MVVFVPNCPSNYYSIEHFNYNPTIDCNDSNILINPNATEICDGKDNNCDGLEDILSNGTSLCSSPSNISWFNLKDSNISSANTNDDIALYFGNESIGTPTNYSIYTSGGISLLNSSTTRGFTVIRTNVSNIYYFNISTNNGVTWTRSRNISISGVGDTAPNAEILTFDGFNYSVNATINFIQASYDEDDLLNLTWDFGDGAKSYANDYSYFEKYIVGNSSTGDTTHSYTSAGSYIVKLNATERDGDVYDIDSIRILILKEGVNVIPIITSPENGKSFKRYVLFDGSDSYVVNCSATMSPFNFTTEDGGLKCLYLHAPDQNRGQNLQGYSLLYNWTMEDGKSVIGYWDSTNYYRVVEFGYRYETAGLHNAKLKISYTKT